MSQPHLFVTPPVPADRIAAEISIGDVFRCDIGNVFRCDAGAQVQPDGPTRIEVTDVSATGMVGVRTSTTASAFDQYTSVPLERVVLLIASGLWGRD